MPVQVKDFEWSETEQFVELIVPLKGVSKGKVDIFSSDLFVKVNFPPYLFEVDLAAPVDDEESKAVVGSGVVKFHLVKKTEGLWGSLSFKGSKDALIQRRLDAQERKRVDARLRDDKRKEEQHEKEREAVRRQMQLEEEERKQREDKIGEEKKKFDDAIERANAASRAKVASKTAKALPAIRKTASIGVTFSNRQFATPERETYKEQEEQWLQKQREARKAVERAKDASLDHDPVWYADKAKEFFANGDFQSAVNALTTAVTLSPDDGQLYAMRAACHLKLKDPHASCVDSSKALSLFMPPVPANAPDRLKAHLRRGAALEMVDDRESALFDYKKALEIAPHDDKIRQIVDKLSAVDASPQEATTQK